MSIRYAGKVIADVGSSGEIYSTEETRIGTWIDGKPLYRKIIYGSVATSAGTFTVHFPFNASIDTLVNLTGTFNSVWGSRYEIPFIEPDTIPPQCMNLLTDANDVIFFSRWTGASEGNILICKMEYTKTTDQATKTLKKPAISSVSLINKESSSLSVPTTMIGGELV